MGGGGGGEIKTDAGSDTDAHNQSHYCQQNDYDPTVLDVGEY